jgi:hypothetical protein
VVFRLCRRWEQPNHTGAPIHFQHLPVLDSFCGPAGANNGWNAILARHDGAVAQYAADVGHDRRYNAE